MLAIISAEISQVFYQIIDDVVICRPEQIADFNFEVEFFFVLIKKLGIQTDKIVEESLLCEKRFLLILEAWLNHLHNGVTKCKIILFEAWTKIFL